MKEELKSSDLSLKDIILSIKNFIALLYPKRKWIITISFLCAVSGFGIAWLIKPSYHAKVTFALNEAGGSMLGAYAGIASQFGINLGGGGSGSVFTEDNIMQLFKSRLMIQQTLLSSVNNNGKQELLINSFIINHELNKKWADKPVLSNLKFQSKPRMQFSIVEDSVLNVIYEDINKYKLSVNKINKKAGIIEVSFGDQNEVFAKQFIEKLIESVSQFYVQTRTKKTKSIVDMLQSKTDSVRTELDRKLQSAAVLKDQSINLIRATGKIEQIKRDKEIEILYVMYTELVKQLELNKISLLEATPVIQLIDTPILPLEKHKKSKLTFGLLGGILGGLLSSGFFLLKPYFKELF